MRRQGAALSRVILCCYAALRDIEVTPARCLQQAASVSTRGNDTFTPTQQCHCRCYRDTAASGAAAAIMRAGALRVNEARSVTRDDERACRRQKHAVARLLRRTR